MNRYYKGNFHHLEKFRMSITREELAATVKDVLTQIMATADNENQRGTKRHCQDENVDVPTPLRRRGDWDIYSKLEFPTLTDRHNLPAHLILFQKVLSSAEIDSARMATAICTSFLNSVAKVPAVYEQCGRIFELAGFDWATSLAGIQGTLTGRTQLRNAAREALQRIRFSVKTEDELELFILECRRAQGAYLREFPGEHRVVIGAVFRVLPERLQADITFAVNLLSGEHVEDQTFDWLMEKVKIFGIPVKVDRVAAVLPPPNSPPRRTIPNSPRSMWAEKRTGAGELVAFVRGEREELEKVSNHYGPSRSLRFQILRGQAEAMYVSFPNTMDWATIQADVSAVANVTTQANF